MGLLLLAACWIYPATAGAADVIGMPMTYVVQPDDTLLDIARNHDVGYVEIRAANPGADPWLPEVGRTVTLPTRHVLPDAPRRGIVINLAELRLYYFPPNGGQAMSFPLGIGGEGKETPVGTTQVVRKRVHPIWIPTASEHAEKPELPAVVPAGPDNPMGDFALYLGWRGYAIHGTNNPYSIGRRDSHGCIRLLPEDIERLFRLVPVGTPVRVVDQPAKVGWLGGQLYLEIHPGQADADALEETGRPRTTGEVDADQMVIKAAGRAAPDLDWYAIHAAEARRDGIAVPVLKESRPSQ